MLSARNFFRYSACLIASPWRAKVPAVRVELRPVPRWSRNRTYSKSQSTRTSDSPKILSIVFFALAHLVALAQGWLDKSVILRGTTSKAWPALEIHKPWQLGVLLGRFNGLVPARDTSSKQSQCAIIGLAIIQGHIEEQLGHTELSWWWVSGLQLALAPSPVVEW